MPATYSPTGSVQTHEVDEDTDTVVATVKGGGAGDGAGEFTNSAGRGATVVAEFDVSGGETLYLRVGEGGEDAADTSTPGFGGWPTGGDGANAEGAASGGGGAHSGIRLGSDTEDARMIGAGGGAAAGAAGSNGESTGFGGDALIPDGEDGGDSFSDGAEGGTLNEPGSGGGSDGEGMNGGNADSSTFSAGGPGGGGFFGGGGATGGGGGGAGSTFTDGAVTVLNEDGGSVAGDGEIVIEEQIDDVVAPSDVSVDNTRDTETDLSWTVAENLTSDGGHRLYRSTSVGVDTTDTLVADLGPTANSYTDQQLDNGTTYYYRVEAYREGDQPDSDLSNEANGTTTIPAIEQLAASADTLGEIAVSWETDQNTGDIRVEFRQTGASTWTGHELLPFTARESTIAELLDGQAYQVRVRGETSDTTGAWSETTETTLLPALNIQFRHVTADSIEIGWTEPDNPDTTYVLERADADDVRDPDPTFSAFAMIAESAPTVLDDDVSESERFRYRVTADTGDASTTDERGVQADFTFSDNYTAELVLDDGDESATIPVKSRDWIQPPGNWRREPSAITTWEGTIPYSPGAENWTRADAYIYFGGELLLSGELLVATSQDSAGETRLEGDGDVIKLTRGGAVDDYQNVEAHTAIDQYEDEHLDEWVVNVEEPDDELVDEALIVQDADTTDGFGDVFSEAIVGDNDVPARVVDGGLEVTRTNILLVAGPDTLEPTGGVLGDEFVDGVAENFVTDGETGTLGTVTTHHTIAEDDVGVAVRGSAADDDASPPVELSLVDADSDSTIGTVVFDPGLTDFSALWIFDSSSLLDGWGDGDIAPGSYEIHAEALDSGADDGTMIDAVSIFDARFHDPDTVENGGEFDGEVHEPEGHLDGPATHPNPAIGADIASDGFGQSFNIEAATVTTSIDDISGSQRLQASNDNGQTFLPTDGTETNTQTVTADFSDGEPFGTIARGRVRLNAWSPDGTRDDATPRENYAGQRVESWELAIDTNNIAVLDDFEVAGNHFENLQDLCNEAGMVFVPEYDRDELRLDVFVPGQETREAEWTRLDFERELDVRSYANRVRVIGARDEATGERIEATAESQPEIDRVGTVVDAPPIVEDDVESEERLRNIARRELSKRVAEDRLGGSVDIVPKPLRPGFAYEVDALDGLEIPLQGVEFRDTREPTGTLEFREPDDLAAAIAGIRTSIRRS